jgi:hypothetical protein
MVNPTHEQLLYVVRNLRESADRGNRFPWRADY